MQLLKGVRSYGVNFILMMLLYANKQTNHQKTKTKNHHENNGEDERKYKEIGT